VRPRYGLSLPRSSPWPVVAWVELEGLQRKYRCGGCQNGAVLWQGLSVAGFPGSAGAVRRHAGGGGPCQVAVARR